MSAIPPSPTPPAMTPAARVLAQLQYAHVEQQAALATTKATLLVAAQAIVGSAYVNLAKDCQVFSSLGTSWAGIAFGASGLLFLFGFLLALASVFPRTQPNSPEDVFFYANIATRWPTSEAYWNAFLVRDADDRLDRDLIENVYGKSRWLMRNFRLVQKSLAAVAGGTLAAAAAFFVFQGVTMVSCGR